MYTYIVIDDESLIRKGTIKKLQPMEEQISCIGEADNGKAGIELIQEVHPDFVILDMQMPIMGGKELLPYLAENYPEMPLIVISGYRDFDYVKQFPARLSAWKTARLFQESPIVMKKKKQPTTNMISNI